MTFTTAAFGRSSSWLFEASPYRAAPKGLPSSFVQLRITVWTGDARDTSMVEDMASYGGHAPATDNAASQKMEAMVTDALKGGSTRYLIAQSANGDPLGVAGAELITLGGAFAPKKTIHIHVVYVLPQFRRSGVASALLSQILDWGRTIGAEQCTLNVLANNPARSLYDKCGFSAFELKLVRPLQSGD